MVLPAVAFLLLAVLSTYNLVGYPTTWYDEGVSLVAARTLAETGQYGLQSSEGLRLFDPLVTTGPAVIGPVALLLKIFGVGLLQARAVMVVYLLFAGSALYLVARAILGPTCGAASLLVFVSLTSNGPLYNGRWVLGEVPGVAFLLLGVAVLIRARVSHSEPLQVAGGFLFGLAALAKLHFLLIIPALCLVWLLHRRSGESWVLRDVLFIITGICTPIAGWYLYQLLSLGPSQFWSSLQILNGEMNASGYSTPFRHSVNALRMLFASGFAVWGGAALVYAWFLMLARQRRVEYVLLLYFATLWLVWFVLFSQGWLRYSVPLVLVSCVFVGKLVADTVGRVSLLKLHNSLLDVRRFAANPLNTAIASLVCLQIIGGVGLNTYDVVRTQNDDSVQRFAAFIGQETVPASTIESFEWEVSFFSDASFHHPPANMDAAAAAVATRVRTRDVFDSYQLPSDVEYLVDGPFSKQTDFYQRELSSGSFRLLGSVGGFDLYQRIATV